VTDHTAVGVRIALNTGFHAARARLKILVEGGMLPRASEVAYGEGIAGLAELADPSAGQTRLADVCQEDLTETYWPPPGRAGTGLGQAIVRRCATAVIGSLLDSVACELVHSAGIAGC